MPYKNKDKQREYNRKKKLEYYHRDPKTLNKERRKYKRTKASKAKQKEYSQKYYQKKRLERIEYARSYRENNREAVNANQRRRNRISDPTIDIGDALRSYNRGDISFSEYCGRVQSVVDQIDEEHRHNKSS